MSSAVLFFECSRALRPRIRRSCVRFRGLKAPTIARFFSRLFRVQGLKSRGRNNIAAGSWAVLSSDAVAPYRLRSKRSPCFGTFGSREIRRSMAISWSTTHNTIILKRTNRRRKSIRNINQIQYYINSIKEILGPRKRRRRDFGLRNFTSTPLRRRFSHGMKRCFQSLRRFSGTRRIEFLTVRVQP